jgi:diphthine synthase
MGELIFVGLGLGTRGISLEGVSAVKRADQCYLEYYTTPHEPALLHELESATGKNFTIVDRNFLEDGRKLLEEAQKTAVVVAVPGDPMIATTHNELRVRAIEKGIKTKVIHAVTIASAAASVSGLHYYKFGGTITVTRGNVGAMQQVYQILHRNLLFGMHTLLLLEVDVESGEGVTPNGAMEGLLLAEKNFKRGVLSEEAMALVLSRVGRSDFEGKAGTISSMIEMDFGEQPHCLIFPGKLHFTELEAISAIFSLNDREITDNSKSVERTAEVLIPRYVDKTRRALEAVKEKLGKEHELLLENVELYASDAERFLADGEDELAMLNIGYAEGLLDSLGFTGKAKIDW